MILSLITKLNLHKYYNRRIIENGIGKKLSVFDNYLKGNDQWNSWRKSSKFSEIRGCNEKNQIYQKNP